MEYDLLLQKTKFSSGFKGNEGNNNAIIRPTDHAYSHNTDFMPISLNESFRIGYSVTRGMEIEFYRDNEFVDKNQESPEQQIVPVSLV